MEKPVFAVAIFLILSCPFFLFSQADSIQYPKNYLSTNLLKPLFRHYTIRYERMINPKVFLRFEAAYRYPKNTDSYENTISAPIKLNNKQTVFTTCTFSMGYGRILLPKNGFYFAADIIYRYKYYENKYYYDCVGTSMDSHVYLESEFNNDFEIMPQIGFKIIINKKNSVKFIIDPYVGAGLLFRIQKEILYAQAHGSCSSASLEYFPEPKETYNRIFSPAFIIGIKVGVGF